MEFVLATTTKHADCISVDSITAGVLRADISTGSIEAKKAKLDCTTGIVTTSAMSLPISTTVSLLSAPTSMPKIMKEKEKKDSKTQDGKKRGVENKKYDHLAPEEALFRRLQANANEQRRTQQFTGQLDELGLMAPPASDKPTKLEKLNAAIGYIWYLEEKLAERSGIMPRRARTPNVPDAILNLDYSSHFLLVRMGCNKDQLAQFLNPGPQNSTNPGFGLQPIYDIGMATVRQMTQPQIEGVPTSSNSQVQLSEQCHIGPPSCSQAASTVPQPMQDIGLEASSVLPAVPLSSRPTSPGSVLQPIVPAIPRKNVPGPSCTAPPAAMTDCGASQDTCSRYAQRYRTGQDPHGLYTNSDIQSRLHLAQFMDSTTTIAEKTTAGPNKENWQQPPAPYNNYCNSTMRPAGLCGMEGPTPTAAPLGYYGQMPQMYPHLASQNPTSLQPNSAFSYPQPQIMPANANSTFNLQGSAFQLSATSPANTSNTSAGKQPKNRCRSQKVSPDGQPWKKETSSKRSKKIRSKKQSPTFEDNCQSLMPKSNQPAPTCNTALNNQQDGSFSPPMNVKSQFNKDSTSLKSQTSTADNETIPDDVVEWVLERTPIEFFTTSDPVVTAPEQTPITKQDLKRSTDSLAVQLPTKRARADERFGVTQSTFDFQANYVTNSDIHSSGSNTTQINPTMAPDMSMNAMFQPGQDGTFSAPNQSHCKANQTYGQTDSSPLNVDNISPIQGSSSFLMPQGRDAVKNLSEFSQVESPQLLSSSCANNRQHEKNHSVQNMNISAGNFSPNYDVPITGHGQNFPRQQNTNQMSLGSHGMIFSTPLEKQRSDSGIVSDWSGCQNSYTDMALGLGNSTKNWP